MYQFGSISEGTLLARDLLPAFADTLRDLTSHEPHLALCDEADEVTDYESEEADFLLDDVENALLRYAPPYAYFGSHPGDGASFGFWPDWEGIDEGVRSGDLLKVTGLDEVPDGFNGLALEVNDHGNATLWIITDGVGSEVWSVV